MPSRKIAPPSFAARIFSAQGTRNTWSWARSSSTWSKRVTITQLMNGSLKTDATRRRTAKIHRGLLRIRWRSLLGRRAELSSFALKALPAFASDPAGGTGAPPALAASASPMPIAPSPRCLPARAQITRPASRFLTGFEMSDLNVTYHTTCIVFQRFEAGKPQSFGQKSDPVPVGERKPFDILEREIRPTREEVIERGPGLFNSTKTCQAPDANNVRVKIPWSQLKRLFCHSDAEIIITDHVTGDGHFA